MNILIVDDEASSRELIKQYLSDFFHELTVCAEASNVAEAYEALVLYRPQLVLLDVDLPDGNAFDLLNKFQKINFSIIFITAYEQFAIKAFKFSAVDYLLKPFTSTEFTEAIERARQKISEQESALKLNALLQNVLQQPRQISKIVLRTSESIFLVEICDIIRLQADGSYTTFYFSNHKPLVISKNLKEYETMLDTNGFMRTHQSHLINSKHIVCYKKSDGGSLVLSDGSSVPVSMRFKAKIIKQIEQI